MAKVIVAREDDKGNKETVGLVLLVVSFVGGFGGLPIGALLSTVMQIILKDSSPLVMYAFYALPILVGMFLAVHYTRKGFDAKDRTVCQKCKKKMRPRTEEDTLFWIPAENDQQYQEPFRYLARYMERVYAIREIPPRKRGCYVCCYVCEHCGNRMVRIADFLPAGGTCDWKETYYYNYDEFVRERQKEDLL